MLALLAWRIWQAWSLEYGFESVRYAQVGPAAIADFRRTLPCTAPASMMLWSCPVLLRVGDGIVQARGSSPATASTKVEAEPAIHLFITAIALDDPTVQGLCYDVRYFGFGAFARLNLLPESWIVLPAINSTACGRAGLAAERYFYAYGPFVPMVLTDSS